MTYQSYSVREIVNRINASKEGLFLPTTQRPYVWGSRFESELYIYKLFDSLLRRYPIGGLIIWNTKETIPFRRFIEDYNDRIYIENDSIRNVDKGLWEKEDKWLVYDGQQRLQTLYSCLRCSFNGKVLFFNLLFDPENKGSDSDETGFCFFTEEEIAKIGPNWLRMTGLFSQSIKNEFEFEEKVKKRNENLGSEQMHMLRKNLSTLWKTFVEEDRKLLSCFEIQEKEEYEVNEIFQRINTGGIPLSNADLILSKIKEKFPSYQEDLQALSNKMYQQTRYVFDVYNILQVIYLLIKKTIRVDPRKVENNEFKKFYDISKVLESPLQEFIYDFLFKEFKINNSSIIPKKLALIPIIIYLYEVRLKNSKFEKLSNNNLLKIKQFFILSQINDWNTMGIIDEFTRIIREDAKSSGNITDFPFKKLIDWLNQKGKRKTILSENTFLDYLWFPLKILTPNRSYDFSINITGRFNPEIDHIFPERLKGTDENYKKEVDILWNLQPVKGSVNDLKRAKHPKEFFQSEEGKKYLGDYDYLPSTDLNDSIWDNHREFIKKRREKMINFFGERYKIIFDKPLI